MTYDGYYSIIRGNKVLISATMWLNLENVKWKKPRDFPGGPNTGDLGSVPGQGTISHRLQPRVHVLQWRSKILHGTTKKSQINKLKNIKREISQSQKTIWCMIPFMKCRA